METGKKHTNKTRQKMSLIRKRYYLEHPEKKEINKFVRTKKMREQISNSLKEYFKNHSERRKKISERMTGTNSPFYGTKHSLERRKQNSIIKLGRKNPSWKHGKYVGKHHYTKEREHYDCFFNNKFKRAIRQRDNQICMLCNTHREQLKLPLAVHHINYDSTLTIPENCISLCFNCHSKTRGNRQRWINFFQNLLSEKYNYQYENNLVKQDVEITNEI